MATRSKTALILLETGYQAQVWRAALNSQNIAVIGSPSHKDVSQVLRELEATDIGLPDLLLIELETRNPYDLCRWCRQHYPSLKIVLISNAQTTIPSTERRWAIHQGADELLPKFQKRNLVSTAISAIDRILVIINGFPLREPALVEALIPFGEREDLSIRTTSPILSSEGIDSEATRTREATLVESETATSSREGESLSLSPRQDCLSTPSRWYLILPWLMSILQGVILFLLLASIWQLKPRWQSKLQPSESESPPVSQQIYADTFQQVSGVPEGLFNYDGSATWSTIVSLVKPQLQKAYPNLQLRYVNLMGQTPGSSSGIQMLLDGQLDFALSSRPLDEKEYAIAKERGFMLTMHPVAINGIAIAVNQSLPVSQINLQQLQQIYLGKLTNWKQLGSQDLEIVPLTRQPEDSGEIKFFQDTLLQGQNFGDRVKYVYSTTNAIRQLQQQPGGIYIASAAQIVYQCRIKPLPINFKDRVIAPYQGSRIPPEECPQQRNQVNHQAFQEGTYPLTDSLYVIVKQNGDREQRIGEAFVKLMLSKQGQKLIEQAGFVPIQ
jgi:phosphate transport system substrate-binding protein